MVEIDSSKTSTSCRHFAVRGSITSCFTLLWEVRVETAIRKTVGRMQRETLAGSHAESVERNPMLAEALLNGSHPRSFPSNCSQLKNQLTSARNCDHPDKESNMILIIEICAISHMTEIAWRLRARFNEMPSRSICPTVHDLWK